MQHKSVVIVLFAAGLALFLQGLAHAGETLYRFDLVTQTSRAMEFKNLRAGYKLFMDNCKSCHFRGNEKGARFLDTDSRTMRGWNIVFYKKNVQCAKDGSWSNLSQEELLAVNDYLFSKAYDTWDPRSNRSCG
jgi:mono/diheme cytochrome c family protein